MAKFNKAKKSYDDPKAPTRLTFEFANGKTISVDPSSLDDTVRTRAMFHGLSQKIGDSYASAETVEEAYEAAVATKEALEKGDWSTRTVGTGESRVTMLVEALYRCTKSEGRTLEDCGELVEAMDDDQRKGLKKVPQIKAAIDAIEAERAAARAAKSAAATTNAPLDLSAFGA